MLAYRKRTTSDNDRRFPVPQLALAEPSPSAFVSHDLHEKEAEAIRVGSREELDSDLKQAQLDGYWSRYLIEAGG